LDLIEESLEVPGSKVALVRNYIERFSLADGLASLVESAGFLEVKTARENSPSLLLFLFLI
jgi:hypothetical protein